jgi:NitT/TauT family transport system permease protein
VTTKEATQGRSRSPVPDLLRDPETFTRLLPFLSFGAILLLWHWCVSLPGHAEAVLPGPRAVLRSFWELTRNGTLVKYSVASLFRVTTGFYLAALAGIPLGIALGLSKTTKRLFGPTLHFLRPISPLAWIPLAMLWFGVGDKPAIFLIFLSSVFPLVLSTSVAVERIEPTYFQVAANFGFTKLELMSRIILPAILPSVLTALRISLGIAWLVVVAAEMIAVKSGLGYLIIDSRNALRMDFVIDGMVVIGAIGLIVDNIMDRLTRCAAVFRNAKR